MVAREDALHERQQLVVVLYYQHALLVGSGRWLVGRNLGWVVVQLKQVGCLIFVGQLVGQIAALVEWQSKAEHRAFAHLALDTNLGMVKLCNLLDKRQTYTVRVGA